MTAAEQRTCPTCGAPFTWTPAAPRQRFCSTPCRQRWWDRSRRRRSRPPGDDPHGHDPRRSRADDPHGHDAGTLAAIPSCPHCKQPVAIVAWLVPPAAASVTTPPRHADTIGDY